jgi:flagellar export protein FliJ
MMRSKRFEPIQEIAANAAIELSRAMADAQRRVLDLERQHEQLKNYRDEYLRKYTAADASSDPVRLQNFRAFLDRLGEALRQHVQKLGLARAEFESRRTVWTEKRIEAESLTRVVERFRCEEQRAVEQQEQNESDEAAQRIAFVAADPLGSG